MGNKRKFVPKSNIPILTKSVPIEVIAEDVRNHPICLHGPTLLFSNEKGRFFACSLCRNKKDCPVLIPEEDWRKESVKKRNEKYLELITKVDKNAAWKNLTEVKSQHPSNRAYCLTCSELFTISPKHPHNKDHSIVTPLTDEQLAKPTTWLPALNDDTVEAQYLFSKKSVAVILQTLQRNNISNILCIGTPSVHEAASAHPSFDSLLLDYDKRHGQFHSPDKYIYYNMFNNFMFNGRDDEVVMKKFFRSSRDKGLCIVMDPPFGGRVEPLVQTVKELSDSYNHVTKKEGVLPVVWAFPYFSEPHIVNAMPEFRMHDYQVEYENHSKFHTKNNKGRKFGSPVRLFTNLPLETIDLSNDSKYKRCEKCNVWVASTNNHCEKCDKCTSKNGMTYKHCAVCRRCVKPTFFHCKACGRCCQQKDHVCGVTVESQSCFNCHNKGHKRVDCPQPQLNETPVKKRKHA